MGRNRDDSRMDKGDRLDVVFESLGEWGMLD